MNQDIISASSLILQRGFTLAGSNVPCSVFDVRGKPQHCGRDGRPQWPTPTVEQTPAGRKWRPRASRGAGWSRRWLFFHGAHGAHDKEVRQNHQGLLLVPAGPTPHCIIAHAEPLLAVFTTVSIGHRMPLSLAKVSTGVSTGAVERAVLSAPVSGCLRKISQTSGPGKLSRTATTRRQAQSARSGP